jgi:hypothetical protein
MQADEKAEDPDLKYGRDPAMRKVAKPRTYNTRNSTAIEPVRLEPTGTKCQPRRRIITPRRGSKFSNAWDRRNEASEESRSLSIVRDGGTAVFVWRRRDPSNTVILEQTKGFRCCTQENP